ncbi:MAG: hypothetical protein JNM63_15900, partial [Spirochaetia bacterium]|nr:hypothetical protein [Spirochaetia bacterium]
FKPGTPSALRKSEEPSGFDPSGAYREFREFLSRALARMQTDARHLLANRSEIGSFIPGGRFASLVKATFRNDRDKPLSVMQARVSVNLKNEDLVFPIFHLDTPLTSVLREIIQLELSGEMLHQLASKRGRSSLLESVALAEKLGNEFHPDAPKRESLDRARSLLDQAEFAGQPADPGAEKEQRVWKKVFRFLEDSGALRRGFRSAVESLAAILEKYGVSYRHCEYHKNILELHIREFEAENAEGLPDEHFTLDLLYQDAEQIEEERQRYAAQISFYGKECQLLEDVADAVKRSPLSFWIIRDYEDLVRRTSSWRLKNLHRQDLAHENRIKGSDIPAETRERETEAEHKYKRFQGEIAELKARLSSLGKRLAIYPGNKTEAKRELLYERARLLEDKILALEFQSNPYQLQPGLRLEAVISTGKEKRYTLEKISRAVSDFIMDVVERFGESLASEKEAGGLVPEKSSAEPVESILDRAPSVNLEKDRGYDPPIEEFHPAAISENDISAAKSAPAIAVSEAELKEVISRMDTPAPAAPAPKVESVKPPPPAQTGKDLKKKSGDDEWVELDEL